MQAIIVAIITGGLSLIGVVFSNISSNKKMENSLESNLKTQQAIFDTKLEELTREVREHNNFAHRVPVIEEHIKRIDARLEKLERKHE